MNMVGSLKLRRLIRVARVRQVDVYVHWSVFLISAVMVLATLRNPLVTLIGLASYLGVLIIHEAGHLIMARRRGYDAVSIELYAISGTAYYERPESRFDRAAIAWGGVVAQAAIAVPIALCTAVLGYSRFEALNVALVVLAGFSILIAAFNLLPFRTLDGSAAWDLLPAFIERTRVRRTRRAVPYRSPR